VLSLRSSSDSTIRKQTGNPLSTAGDYSPKVQAQAERWERNQKSATIESDLEVDPIEAELNQLADAMAKIAGSSDYFGLLGVEQQAKAANEYGKERETVAALLGQLMPWGSTRQDSLQAALEDLDRKTEAARAEEEIRELCLPRLVQLRDEVRLALNEAFGRHEELRQQCSKADTAIAKEVAAFEQTLARYDQSFLTKSPEYQAYFKTLVAQHKPLQGMMEERDLDLLAGTAADLSALLARVQVGHAALKGRSLPPGAPTLDAVDTKVSKGRDALGTEVLSEHLPSTHRTLKSQLDDIAKNKLKRPIDTSLDALAQWQQQLNAALVKAAQAEQDYANFKAELKGVQKKLDAAEPQFADQPQYLEALQARLDACLTAGKAEGQLAGEQDVLKQIEADLALALSDPEAMKAGQQQASAVAELKKQDKATWKGLYQAFSDTTLPQVRKLADGALVRRSCSWARRRSRRSPRPPTWPWPASSCNWPPIVPRTPSRTPAARRCTSARRWARPRNGGRAPSTLSIASSTTWPGRSEPPRRRMRRR